MPSWCWSRGALQAHVIHAATTSWILHAGPYRVRVTGTRFGLSWRAGAAGLSLYEGSVVVDGAALGSGVPVRAGQRLTVASGVVRIEPLAGAKATTVALAAPAGFRPRCARAPPVSRSCSRERAAARPGRRSRRRGRRPIAPAPAPPARSRGRGFGP